MEIYEVDDDVKDALRAALVSLSDALHIFGSDHAGYGVHADLEDGAAKQKLNMHPFCWCDGMECPYCAGHLVEEEGYSNHEILRLEPIFAAKGFVTGMGAPNFQLQSEDISIRIWWYKYIGRGMRSDRAITLQDVDLMKSTWMQILSARKADIYRASIDAELDPQMTGLSPEVSQTLRDGFMALLLTAPKGEVRLQTIKRVQDSLNALKNTTYHATQAIKAGDVLDAAAVPRFENPEDPEEMRLEFSLTHRLEKTLSGETPQGEEINF